MTALPHIAPASGEWETKYHKDVPWDTTSDATDLDAEVAVGARILKYADGSYVHAIHRQYPTSCGPAWPSCSSSSAWLSSTDAWCFLDISRAGGRSGWRWDTLGPWSI